ncbi:hypothetical protein JTB14_038107 [Gonioctena quinquepunctata]|nr:hypothetical protein JTB14_038107 [Gonioctena quinquepunctata]
MKGISRQIVSENQINLEGRNLTERNFQKEILRRALDVGDIEKYNLNRDFWSGNRTQVGGESRNIGVNTEMAHVCNNYNYPSARVPQGDWRGHERVPLESVFSERYDGNVGKKPEFYESGWIFKF